MGLVRVEGDKTIEGLAKVKIKVKTFLSIIMMLVDDMKLSSGMTLTQAAAVLAREDHLKLLLQFG